MLDVSRPFTRTEALAAGLTDRVLAGADYRRLFIGVYASSRIPDSAWLWGSAAVRCVPGVLSHTSAARLYGAPVPHDDREHVTVGAESDRRTREGLRCHVAALTARDVRVVRGLRVTSPERTFVDLAETLGLVDLVVLGDWLVRHELTSCSALVARAAEITGRGARKARRAAAYVREDVDSPMESRLRMLLVLAGLPEPRVNLKIRDENGVVMMRIDLCWPEVRLAVEYDGRQHVEDIGQWERDIERREDLGESWRVIRVTNKGVFRTPAVTIDRVWRALRDRGMKGLRPPTDGWRPHFR